MKPIVVVMLLVALVSLSLAGTTSRFATVTYTDPDPAIPPWIDSGVIVEDHQFASTFEGYTYRFIVFTDHVNEYHLDGKGGRVDIAYR